MNTPLTGPRVSPVHARPDSLVAFVHGYGANGDDLIGISSQWRNLLPNTAFVSPHAPQPCPGVPSGRQWFSISTPLNPNNMLPGVESAAPLLLQYLQHELQRLNIPPSRLALVGFSQGTMLSLHLGLSMSPPPAAIVGYSGALATTQHIPPNHPAPPVTLIHGAVDDRIPPQASLSAAAQLAARGVCSRWSLRPNLGHSIDAHGLQLGAFFIADALAGRLQSNAPPQTLP